MKTDPSIRMRRSGPPLDVLCSAAGCNEVVTTLASGERTTSPGPGAAIRRGTCRCGKPWSVAVAQEAEHGQ